MEYGGVIPEDEVARAWDEVESALGNFFGMRELAAELKSAKYLVASGPCRSRTRG